MRAVLSYVGASILSLVAAAVTYASGLWVGRFLDPRPWSETCAGKPLDDVNPYSASWGPLTLSNMCRWSDGTTKELVPSYVNPLTLALLVLAAACLALAVRAAWHSKSKPPNTNKGLPAYE